MLTTLKNTLNFLFNLNDITTNLEEKHNGKIRISRSDLDFKIYNAFTDEYYNDHIIYLVDQDTFISIIEHEIVYFDLLSSTIKKGILKKYKNYVILEYNDNTLYEECINNDDSYLILVNDDYVINKANKLKYYTKYIDIFDNQLFKLYQNYKNDILPQLRNKKIILNVGKKTDEIKYLEYFMLLFDITIKYKIYLDKLKNDKYKIFSDLKRLKININNLLEEYLPQKFKSYQSVITYKYNIDDYIDGFIIHCKFNYTNAIDLILYSDFIGTMIKS